MSGMAYSETRLVLLIVDPYLVHCYWSAPARRRGTAVLRFHGQSPESFDIDIDLQAGNWYVPLWRPEESLYAELLMKTPDGTLTRLARSQVVHLPRVRPVTTIEEHFMKVEPPEQRAELVPPPSAHRTHLDETVPPAEEIIESAPVLHEETPLLIQEGWRGAPGWSLQSQPDSILATPPVDLTSAAEKNLFPNLSSWR